MNIKLHYRCEKLVDLFNVDIVIGGVRKTQQVQTAGVLEVFCDFPNNQVTQLCVECTDPLIAPISRRFAP